MARAAFTGDIRELEAVELKAIRDEIEYVGFNRDKIIAKLVATGASAKVIATVAAIGASRGSNFSKLAQDKISADVKTFVNSHCYMGKEIKGKASDQLTIMRVTTALPNFAAYYLLKVKSPAKIPNHPCPTSLQFPAAASLPMSDRTRKDHVDFCMEFSKRLPNGKFSMDIYNAMMANEIPKEEINQELHSILGI